MYAKRLLPVHNAHKHCAINNKDNMMITRIAAASTPPHDTPSAVSDVHDSLVSRRFADLEKVTHCATVPYAALPELTSQA